MSLHVRLLVTVGTDHHEFDRVVDWVDSWLEMHPRLNAHALVQHGTSRPSRNARSAGLLDYRDLQAAMRSADLVVTHGGPATIFEARRHGHQPLCVPRQPSLGEHVDDHQVRFARYLGQAGLVTPCSTEEELHQRLTTGLLGATPPRGTGLAPELPRGGVALGHLVHRLVHEGASTVPQVRHEPRTHRSGARSSRPLSLSTGSRRGGP